MDISRFLTIKSAVRKKNEKAVEARISDIYKRFPKLRETDDLLTDLRLKKSLKILNKQDVSGEEKEIKKTEKKRKSLMSKIGISESDFSVDYDCTKCRDTGYDGPAICSCVRALAADAVREEYSLSQMLDSQNFGRFDPYVFSNTEDITIGNNAFSQRDIMENNRDLAEEFSEKFPEGRSLLFIGGTGLGKTFLANCIADAVIKKGFLAVYYRHTSLETLLSEMMSFNPGEEAKEKDSLLRLADLLIIDDLAAPRYTNLASALFEIVDERIASKKSTIITTNMDHKEIMELHGERFHSRLLLFDAVKFYGGDIRKKL